MSETLYRPQSYTICIDIGFRFTGVVVYDDLERNIRFTGCIRVKPRKRDSKAQSHLEECQLLADKLDHTLKTFPNSRVIVESPSGGGKSSIAVKAMASSVAILASVCRLHETPITLVTPLDIKRLVRAKGAVTKEEVQELVENKLTDIGFKYPYKYAWCKDHVADAGAVLIVAHNKGLVELNQ